jgi:hypothetical protein
MVLTPDLTRRDLQNVTHMAALAWAYLGEDTELTDRLAAMPHGELVALAVDLADRSAWAHQVIWSRLAR